MSTFMWTAAALTWALGLVQLIRFSKAAGEVERLTAQLNLCLDVVEQEKAAQKAAKVVEQAAVPSQSSNEPRVYRD